MAFSSFLLLAYLTETVVTNIPFSDVVHMHKDWCSTSCEYDPNQIESLCCGTCRCHLNECYEHGTCCLEEFDSLESARQSLEETLYVILTNSRLLNI